MKSNHNDESKKTNQLWTANKLTLQTNKMPNTGSDLRGQSKTSSLSLWEIVNEVRNTKEQVQFRYITEAE